MPAMKDESFTWRDFLATKGKEIFGKGEARILDQLRKRGFTLVDMTETKVMLNDGSSATIEMLKTPEGTCFECSRLPSTVRQGVSNVLGREYLSEAFGEDESAHPKVLYK